MNVPRPRLVTLLPLVLVNVIRELVTPPFSRREQGPRVSPWRRCAATALCATLIVVNGWFLEPVR